MYHLTEQVDYIVLLKFLKASKGLLKLSIYHECLIRVYQFDLVQFAYIMLS